MKSQEFNKVTTTSNFIKNLLISTYLPLIRTVRDFDYIIADRLYIYKCNVIKCTKSGYIVTGYKYFNFNGERAQFRIVSEYYFGERNDKLCTNYISNSEGYDAITHERLGKYLRNLRDMYDLNLMPLYNCFSNQILPGHYISDQRVIKTATDYNTKIYRVPIRFNTDYTICMDVLGSVVFAPAFIKNNNLLKVNNTRFGNDTDVTNKYIKLYQTDVVTQRTNDRYVAPFKIRYNNIPHTRTSIYYKYEYEIIDYLHIDSYYTMYTFDQHERNTYYVRVPGTYDFVYRLTQDEYNVNPTKYYYNNNGTMVQCSADLSYDINRVYYTRSSSDGYTYLITNEKPDPEHPEKVFYIGPEPATGRSDTTYTLDKRGFWTEDTTLNQDIFDLTYSDPTLTAELQEGVPARMTKTDNAIVIQLNTERILDGENFETVVFWIKCSKASEYFEGTTYYINTDNTFVVWDYKESGQEEAEYNIDPTKFYWYDEESQIHQCASTDAYDITKIYYVVVDNAYMKAEENYWLNNKKSFYYTNTEEFDADPTKFYTMENGSLVQCFSTDTYDINKTYYRRKEIQITPWLAMRNGELEATEDRTIIEGKIYYSPYKHQIEDSYIYDITEENCALYDYCEDNLYLLIQVPKDYESNICILEGDYTNTQAIKIMPDASIDKMPALLVDYLYTSNLRLMQMNSKKVIPFSETLIEFLLWNAINNLDSINNNMDRLLMTIQSLIVTDEVQLKSTANYWYPQYRKIIYTLVNEKHKIPVIDNLGYVTKNNEQILTSLSTASGDIYDYIETDVDLLSNE